jgi:hypothetical protein
MFTTKEDYKLRDCRSSSSWHNFKLVIQKYLSKEADVSLNLKQNLLSDPRR